MITRENFLQSWQSHEDEVSIISPAGRAARRAHDLRNDERRDEVYPPYLGRGHGVPVDHGTFTPLNPLGANLPHVTAISDRRQFVGDDVDGNLGHNIRGLLFEVGRFTVIDVPEAGFLQPRASDLWGQLVGVTGMTQMVGFLATPTRPRHRLALAFTWP